MATESESLPNQPSHFSRSFLSQLQALPVSQRFASLIRPVELARPVLWDGHIDKETKLVIVGEAPGRNEQIRGVPFIGRSGQLLRGMLRELLVRNSYGYFRSDSSYGEVGYRGILITNPVFYVPLASEEPVDLLSDSVPIRAPTDSELDEFFPLFRRLLDTVVTMSSHEVIWLLAVGNTAGRAILAYLHKTQPSRISVNDLKAYRNSVHHYKLPNGKIVLFGLMYHPSYYLRRGVRSSDIAINEMYKQIRNGEIDIDKNPLSALYFLFSRFSYLDRIFTTAKHLSKEVKQREYKVKLINSSTPESEVRSILSSLGSIVAFDTELEQIAADKDAGFLNWDNLRVSDLSLFDGNTAIYMDKSALEKHVGVLYDFFVQRSQDAKQRWVVHNAVFDLVVLAKYFSERGFSDFLYKFDYGLVRDTMITWHLLNEEDRMGLKYLAPLLLDVEMQQFKDVDKLRHTSTWIDYSLEDSVQAWRLWYVLRPLLSSDNGLKMTMLREMRALGSVVAMVVNGMYVDRERLVEVSSEVSRRIAQLELEMHQIYWDLLQKYGHDHGLGRFVNLRDQAPRPKINFNSPIQLSQIIYDLILFKHCGVSREEIEQRGIKVKKSGILPTDKHAIDKLMDLDSTGFLAKLNEYRKLFKLKSSYLLPLEERYIQSDGKVHGWFKPAGTKTGRFSSENPNLQQIPAEDEFGLRGLFIAEKGWKIAALDYSGQELRLAAIVSGEKTMIEAFKKGQDLHLTTAKQAFNLPIPDEVLVESHPQYKEYKEKFKHERKKAKAVNFGVIYGITAKGLSEQIKTSEEEAQKIIDSYFASKPDLARAIKQTYREVVLNSFATNIFGRQRHFTKLNDASFRQAFNFKIQSAGADIMKHVLGRLWAEVFVPFRDRIKPLATVHDELVVMVREDSLDLVEKVKEIMEDWPFPVKMEVEAGIGDSYGEAK